MDVLALQAGVILGLTSVVGKFIPENMRDRVLPVVALLFGILAVYGTEAKEAMTLLLAFKGVVVGGTVTGLYSVAKDMKTTPNVVVNK